MKRTRFTGKFSGHQFELTENLNSDFDILFKGKGELAGINKKLSNEEIKYVNTIRVLEIIDVTEANTKTQKYLRKIKDGETSNITKSQKMRMWIENLWQALGSEGEKEQFYRNYMDMLIDKIKAEVEIAK